MDFSWGLQQIIHSKNLRNSWLGDRQTTHLGVWMLLVLNCVWADFAGGQELGIGIEPWVSAADPNMSVQW